jgi:hypothetical protein
LTGRPETGRFVDTESRRLDNGAITGSSELGGAIRESDRTMLDVPKESLSLSKKARRELWH